MQVQMTERDKRLIVILSLIVIVVGFGWWGIRPAIKSNKEMSEELEEQENLRTINDQKIAKLAMYEVEADSYDELIVEERKHYFPMMSSSEIDRYFTGMILERGLSSYDLTMRIGSKPLEVDPYNYSQMEEDIAAERDRLRMEEEAANILADSEEEGDGMLMEEEDPFAYTSSIAHNSEIYGVDVTLRLAGNMVDLKQLIEDLSASEQLILVRNCIWTEELTMDNDYDYFDESQEQGSMLRSTTVLNVNLTMYMCDQTETEEE